MNGESLTVEQSVEGLARAVSHLGIAHQTSGPERSHPANRTHPPGIEFGDPDVPDWIQDQTPASDLDVRVPDCLESLLGVAPLAFYLGARVTVDTNTPPTLRAAGLSEPVGLDPVESVVPKLLRRVFSLDCLVREPVEDAERIADASLLEGLTLDVPACRRASTGERVRRYLDVAFEAIEAALPDWHLATYVDPTFEHARCLPALLDQLSAVYPASADPLESRELIERTLEDFFRGQIPSVEVHSPSLQRARLHGWLAEGTPIDVFKILPRAYANATLYGACEEQPISIHVVLNDEAMAEEYTEAEAIYRDRASAVPIDVTLHRGLTRRELRTVFETHSQLVHYIGHCETSGLCCLDGHLAIEDLEESNAESFFLNACGSFYEGAELVRKGSVAGAVTYRGVLDEQAATVGTAFARLLVCGFSIQRAMGLARRRIAMGKDYAVVGDGTHVLSSLDSASGLYARVESTEERFAVSFDAVPSRSPGATIRTPVPADAPPRLSGPTQTTVLDRDALRGLLEDSDLPVIFNGSFSFADELRSRFE